MPESSPESTAVQMATHRALVGDALDVLYRVLRPYVEREMRAVHGDRWERVARGILHGRPPSTWDTSDLLAIIYDQFFKVFRDLGHEGRSRVSLLREVRKTWAHQGDLTMAETRRALETAILLLRAIGAHDEADRLEPHVVEMMQQEVQRKRDVLPAPEPSTLLDRSLTRVRALFQRAPAEPLEFRRAILDDVERAAEPHRRHFAFNRLTIHLLAESNRTRHLFEAALEGPDEPFSDAVHRRLADARIPVPEPLQVRWRFYRSIPERLTGCFGERPFYVEFTRRRTATTATLTVLKGRTPKTRYVVKSRQTLTIGRLEEVVDERGRIVRRNALAFADYEDETLPPEERAILETVSRIHARIGFDEAAGVFRVHDDQSTWGTSVVRTHLHVPIAVRQQPVALQDGDLIYFGKACVRFNTGGRRRTG
ncbi:MAG: FHA domain-containing protein [Bacteroidetes bacterium]|nr:hypothetical protein AWN76_001635 [Rhodothermaceae bacterium RA]RMH54621.1 MAG: FHA domain-containing protein [Bacteroidota bacterium]